MGLATGSPSPGSGGDTAGESTPPANVAGAALARAARVAELREAVAAGRYRPDPREVAAALLESHARRTPARDDR